jgi:integrase
VRLLVDRVDPGAEKAETKEDATKRAANTFAKMSEQWLVERSTRGRRKSPKTLKKDNSILSKWIIPALGKMPVADITARDVKLLLNKMRDAGREASAVRAKMTISAVLRFAINEHLPGMTHDVTSTITVEAPQVRHRASLTEPEKIGPLLADVWDYTGSITVASALKIAFLTALRANELCGARWEEIDLDAAMWTIPPHRMKGTSRRRGEDAKPHHVPLCAEAVEILAALKPHTGKLEHVFPGAHSR